MINLAGHKQATEIITRELTRCGIEVVPADKPVGEPQSLVTGRLGKFAFERAWYYWVVKGDVPLEVAMELYADVVGKTDVRVGGHCGCPSPADYGTKWVLPNGREVISMRNKIECEGYLAKYGGSMAEIATKILAEHDFSDDPASIGAAGFVDTYHIDSELGLYVFVQALKRHGLV